MSGLPSGWCETELGALIEHIQAGLNLKCEERPPRDGEKGLVKISAVTWGRFDEDQSKTLPSDATAAETARIVPGDLLISRANTIELVGATVIVEDVTRALYLSDKVLRLVVPEESKRWINYALKTAEARKAIQDASSGNQLSMRNISQENLRRVTIPLAPLPEQKRIADKLDSVLARVDACRDRLDRIPALLKRFRQSVLNAATSGELSADWRASEALHGWAPVMIKEICLSISDGDHQAPPQVDQGISFITISAFSSGRLDLNKATRCVPQSYFEQLKPMRRPSLGDVLYSVTGSIGISALVDTDRPFAFQRHVALLKPDLSRVSSAYLRYLLGSDGVRRQAADVATGSAQLTIPLNGLRAFNALLPCLAEQHEIVRRVETLFAFAGRLEARCAAARKQAGQLTPALLAKAFRGELVPQDPADEPAAELLKRLATSRAEAPKARRGKARASTGV